MLNNQMTWKKSSSTKIWWKQSRLNPPHCRNCAELVTRKGCFKPLAGESLFALENPSLVKWCFFSGLKGAVFLEQTPRVFWNNNNNNTNWCCNNLENWWFQPILGKLVSKHRFLCLSFGKKQTSLKQLQKRNTKIIKKRLLLAVVECVKEEKPC